MSGSNKIVELAYKNITVPAAMAKVYVGATPEEYASYTRLVRAFGRTPVLGVIIRRAKLMLVSDISRELGMSEKDVRKIITVCGIDNEGGDYQKSAVSFDAAVAAVKDGIHPRRVAYVSGFPKKDLTPHFSRVLHNLSDDSSLAHFLGQGYRAEEISQLFGFNLRKTKEAIRDLKVGRTFSPEEDIYLLEQSELYTIDELSIQFDCCESFISARLETLLCGRISVSLSREKAISVLSLRINGRLYEEIATATFLPSGDIIEYCRHTRVDEYKYPNVYAPELAVSVLERNAAGWDASRISRELHISLSDVLSMLSEKRKYWTVKEVNRLKALWHKEHTQADIAEALGRSLSEVYNKAYSLGLRTSSLKSSQVVRIRRTYTEKEKQFIREARKEGMPNAFMCRRLNVSAEQLKKVLCHA